MLFIENLVVQRLGSVFFEVKDFALQKGSLLIVKGSNGAGKTTFLLTLCHILQERLAHDDAKNQVPVKAPSYFFLPQSLALDPDKTVEKNLKFYQRFFKKEVLRDEPLMKSMHGSDVFEIALFFKRYVRQLSFGEQRRISLTRLMFEKSTDLWILDEPEQGLDQYFQGILIDALLSHCARGGSVIVASHILSEKISQRNTPCSLLNITH